jgi:hypothetical protein
VRLWFFAAFRFAGGCMMVLVDGAFRLNGKPSLLMST